MTALEIILLAAGAFLIAASFFIPEKDAENETDMNALVREEVKKVMESETDNIRKHVEGVVDETVTYAEEKTERALERLTNEKIMAVNEYADSVLEEINKNHKEVMFLYDMLNDKQKYLKESVNEVNEAVKNAQKSTVELKSEPVKETEELTEMPVPIPKYDNRTVRHTSEKAVSFFAGLEAQEAAATVPVPAPAEAPVETKTVRTLNWAELAVSEANAAEQKEALKEGRESEKAIENPRDRINREVIELAESGLDDVEIARRLKMGVGEVGLILGLRNR